MAVYIVTWVIAAPQLGHGISGWTAVWGIAALVLSSLAVRAAIFTLRRTVRPPSTDALDDRRVGSTPRRSRGRSPFGCPGSWPMWNSCLCPDFRVVFDTVPSHGSGLVSGSSRGAGGRSSRAYPAAVRCRQSGPVRLLVQSACAQPSPQDPPQSLWSPPGHQHSTTRRNGRCATNRGSRPLVYLACSWQILELGGRAPSQGYSQIDTRGNSWAGPRTWT